MSKRIELYSTDEVTPGCVLRVEKAELVVAVFNLEGAFYVIDNACTHGPGPLSDGLVDGYRVERNFHFGVFDIGTGDVLKQPPTVPVKANPVVVEDGKVFVDVLSAQADCGPDRRSH